MAQEAALKGWREGGETGYVDGESACWIAGSATASADGAAGEQKLGGDAGELGLPPGFFVTSQGGHVDQMLAKLRVPALEDGQELVADAVAGEGEMAVG